MEKFDPLVPTQINNHLLNKYENFETVAKIIKIAGIISFIAISIAAAAFFSAPTTIPLAVTIVISCIPILIPEKTDSNGFLKLAAFGPSTLFGIGAGIFLRCRIGAQLAQFVYSGPAMAIVGIAAGCIGGLGLILCGAGHYGQKYCAQKIEQGEC